MNGTIDLSAVRDSPRLQRHLGIHRQDCLVLDPECFQLGSRLFVITGVHYPPTHFGRTAVFSGVSMGVHCEMQVTFDRSTKDMAWVEIQTSDFPEEKMVCNGVYRASEAPSEVVS